MAKWIKRLFCKHAWKFERNIYGDEIIYSGWNRSLWFCTKCGEPKLEKVLFEVKA